MVKEKASISLDFEAFFLSISRFMMNLDQEYDLFKKICCNQSVKASPDVDATIRRFIEKGMPIKLTSNHYTLSKETVSLSVDKIRSGLTLKLNSRIKHLNVIFETCSTNEAVKAISSENNYTVLLAESQTDGRGRREKKWVSPIGENIYLSIKFKLINPANIHFLPLIAAVSICKSLIKLGINNCQIKWPNDLYIDNKKLGGILVESRYNVDSGHIIIVGIGLNINMNSNQEIDQSWTSLFNITRVLFDRNIIVSTLLTDLIEQFTHISEFKKQQFMSDWASLDYLNGRKLTIIEGNATYTATSLGISDEGALLVEYLQNKNKPENKTIKKVFSADVSVKALDDSLIKE
ncbi:MAG: biotin--[acetyl-CoA-carboxylase] ligase [gamma proteobacterium symbiont of Bathyaustriella thionipta]|nr:biotin--[acetyl-CoA-carboxylase] ligase [gamma proteobacterium symbiont of Bathyaustriella thionipta]MCU7950597.1 biotin--[acetyl-CoA-carboxylase] ligase [gamma proteobacterium symbiont of Bathyaustriella thionipta]MCU7954735.1 biotin--[acetyl-CoA-carboxylase] ligase [gamma proteobacterium symbiont of Bathyaustriella thionipta]MCU7957105.1 biotin--[acetyl-CoA-carboxylase] ligase [gamma proteobacterium symbiont of Bathyaustriella thionipta]MCU7968989.1 biotin--[acetyl-CoA-carboxylase] ligase 